MGRIFLIVPWLIVLCQHRSTEGAILVDYVAELEAATDKLLQKVAELEEKLENCQKTNAEVKCKPEIEHLKSQFSACAAELESVKRASASLKIKDVDYSTSNPELRDFVRLLLADLERTNEKVLALKNNHLREQLLNELKSIQNKIPESRSFKDLAMAKALLTTVKRKLD